MVAVGGRFSEVDGCLQQFASMRSQRIDFDRKRQGVSDYIRPRRDFSITQRPNQLRPHRVTSSTATNASNRLMALLLSYMVDTTRPFLLPNVKAGLVAAGRDTDLDDDALDFLGKLEWSVFDRMMLPRAQLMSHLGAMLKEYVDFGDGVLWTGRRRGFGPYFNSRPASACWWSKNDEGVIDTLYFKMLLPLHRVFKRWPDTAPQLWSAQDAKAPPNEQQLTSIVMACQPRPGGRAGAVVENKPFAYLAIAEEKGAILERSGFDSFPYQVFQFDPLPGNAYSEGIGCQVLPDVMVLNHLQQCIEDAASQKASPPLAMPARMFGKVLDRRPGAVNAYNAAGLGLARADQAIIKLDFTGDITAAVDLKRSLIDDIEMGYFVDWMRPRESGDQTATEVNDKRDIRLRGMSSIVANCALPMCLVGDRAMEIMAEENILPPAPASLRGLNVDWEYAGPLQIQQLARNAQTMLQLLNARALVGQQDPVAAEAIDVEESLRVIAESLGAPTRVSVSRQAVAAKRAASAQRQQQQDNADKLGQVAAAGRDAGAGVQSLAAAAGQAQGGAPGATFAPAAPLAQPVAA
ncbi:MAG TPA: portal protein [Caulobacteraceae bacterium]|nr:portal protein [Caulobacteraceae bacterium]